ncbi:MAG: tRNA lysidine(34) synthetase TilS [Acidobacteria bacterium]|nr:tRNA lysidine(34) synthetase TilS [Acidobacteriota bacterium]
MDDYNHSMLAGSLRERVLSTIGKYRMLRAGNRVLVAVSGGPDSVALLCVLAQFKKELGLVMAVAHLDHQMRPDSGDDVSLVRRWAERFSLPFFFEARDVPSLVARRGGNLEEVARLQRRDFLIGVSRERNFERIATGHTMDDQAETVLMNVIRGSGATGLGGIAPRRGRWIRPLIEVRRAEVLDFLQRQNAEFRLDPTNQDTRFLRNRVRGFLLPLLRQDYSGNIVERLATLAEIQRGIAHYWARSCRHWVEFAEFGPFLKVAPLRRRPAAEQREAVRLFICNLRGDLRRITFGQIESVRQLLAREGAGKKVTLPGGWEVRRAGGVLRGARMGRAPEAADPG